MPLTTNTIFQISIPLEVAGKLHHAVLVCESKVTLRSDGTWSDPPKKSLQTYVREEEACVPAPHRVLSEGAVAELRDFLNAPGDWEYGE
jgi:hypothetical protein